MSEDIEEALACHGEFGSSRRILDELWTRFDLSIELIGLRYPQTSTFVTCWRTADPEAQQRALGHAVLRNTLHHLAVGTQEPTAADLELLAGASALMESLPSRSTERSPLRAYGAGAANELFDAQLAVLFERELACNVGGGPVTLRGPTEIEAIALGEIWDGVCQIWPRLGPSLALHSSVLAIFDGDDLVAESATKHGIPGAVFIAPTLFGEPWRLAEALVHEMAHKKFSDTADLRQLMPEGYTAATAHTLTIPWRAMTRQLVANGVGRSVGSGEARWPVDQALYALHVYVHLAAFVYCAGRPGLELFRSRARFLAEALGTVAAVELGEAGREALTWLRSVLVEHLT